MKHDPQWMLDLRARRDETFARIDERTRAYRELEKERTAALDWCRSNGSPHLKSKP
jgi:uncharacterized coiled-coil DUF342 family protein